MDLSERIDQLEWMDTRSVSLPVMREILAFLEITNRYFGGSNVMLRHIEKWSRKWNAGTTIQILDIGTGGAEIPTAIARWAKQSGHAVQIIAIDLVDEILCVAQENTRGFNNIAVRKENFFDLVQKAETFDYVIASLLLHHINPDESIRALQAFDRLARRGVIVSDLFRSRTSYWAIKTLSYLIGNDIVRHDGPLSVRRAFQISELESLARQAELPYLQARREHWFRVSLAGEKLQ